MLKTMKGKILVGLSITLGILLVVYLGFTIFFSKHFYYRTRINGEAVGGKTVSEVETQMLELAKNYSLELKERNNKSETIKGEDIGFEYEIEKQIKDLKKAQNPFAWLFRVWKETELEAKLEVKYDEELLKGNFKSLECFLPYNSKKPQNAKLVFEEDSYQIQEGDLGSLVNENKLYSVLEEAISKEETVLDLEAEDCYEKAEYTATSKELIEKRDLLNGYIASKITYDFGDRTELLDGKIIQGWIKIDDEAQVVFDEEAIQAYLTELAIKYDTLYGTRQFKATGGKVISVAGGDYGWRIDKEEEGKALLEILKQGSQEMTREPIYEQEAWCRDSYDIGDTYVEVNLTQQYLWFYKEGQLVTQGSIVSGTGSNSYATPEGTYRIDYTQANATLRGPGYVTPVSFWMPFNSGIGIHDATWRSSFGGTIYMYNGSHGCINAPYDLAQTLFQNVEAGMPVVCYKED